MSNEPLSHLPRGKACVPCRYAQSSTSFLRCLTSITRRRKMVRTSYTILDVFADHNYNSRHGQKCDGNQPTCSQCIRFNREAECQFSEGPSPSTTRVLEQHITRLQSRIQELEQDDPNLVRLHDPYQNYPGAGGSLSAAQSVQGTEQTLNWWESPDPPGQVQQKLWVFFVLLHAPLLILCW